MIFTSLLFKFIDGFDNWNKYTHGIGYNLAILWVIILFLAILIISLSRCAVSDYRKKYMETSCTALGWNDIYNYILYRFK